MRRLLLPWASIYVLCLVLTCVHVRGMTVGVGTIAHYKQSLQRLLSWKRGQHRHGDQLTTHLDERKLEAADDLGPSDDVTSTASNLSPALASPFWVKITEDYGTKSYNYIPATRRAASADVYIYKQIKEKRIDTEKHRQIVVTNNSTTNVTEEGIQKDDHFNNETTQQASDTISSTITEEYMIISGGYTDKDWRSFPVYAFPITSAVRTTSGQWIDLTPSSFDLDEPTCTDEDGIASRDTLYQEVNFTNAAGDDKQDAWANAQTCSPSGRMGHSSVVYNDHLYVFGGLIYDEEQESMGNRRKESFRLEDIPYVYRLNLKEILEARIVDDGEDESTEPTTGWQRIIPRVKPVDTSSSAADVLLNFVNRGEGQGGLWSASSSGDNDKFVMYGGLRITRVEYDNSPSKFVKGDSVFGLGSPSQNQKNQFHSHKIVELPLGDVWAYDLVLNAWEKLTNDNGKGVWVDEDGDKSNGQMNRTNEEVFDTVDDDWMDDLTSTPRSRTAHAATLVENELVIHGGMGWDEKTNDWDGSTDWETLDDMVSQTKYLSLSLDWKSECS